MGYPRIQPDEAAKLAFTDASKNIADLKSRQWQATNFSVLGLVAVATFSQSHAGRCWQKLTITGFAVGILAGYVAVMWRCNRNLGKFRTRLKAVVDNWIPDLAKDLFGIVDEGTIERIAWGWVGVAFVFALLDIWKCFG
ncbi:MAG TPA: hypothetical protein VN776_11345 [Terracidiphilus sp.]|nr:hypothetical protein [Terracidiphilus sp.]